MQSAEWLLHWWNTFYDRSTDQLCILLVYDDDQLIAVAPWYIRSTWVKPRCLRFLGDGVVCSDHSSVLIQSGSEQKVTNALVDWLDENAASVWYAIGFSSIDQHDENLRALMQGLSDKGYANHESAAAGCWTVDMPASQDDYLASLSKNHRKRCRRWQREYFDTGRAEVVRCSDATEIGEYWKLLSDMKRKQFEGREEKSSYDSTEFNQFHNSVLPSLLESQQVELRKLILDGQVVAAEYLLVKEKKFFCYQSGMERSKTRDGYGNLSIYAFFRDAISNGFQQIDFLRGDESYKQHWNAERVPCVDYHVAANTLPGTVQLTYRKTIDWLREFRNTLVSPAANH